MEPFIPPGERKWKNPHLLPKRNSFDENRPKILYKNKYERKIIVYYPNNGNQEIIYLSDNTYHYHKNKPTLTYLDQVPF